MELFGEDGEYVLAVSIPLTALVLIVSMVYTFRRKPVAGDVKKTDQKQKLKENGEERSSNEESDVEQSENQNLDEKGAGEGDTDPVQYCEHIQSEVKKARHRVATKEIRQNLSAEDMENEREIQRKQLEDIFRLMEQNTDKFGATSEDDVQQQMKLYI